MNPWILSFLASLRNHPLLSLGIGIILFSFAVLILAMGGFFLPGIVVPITFVLSALTILALTVLLRTLSKKERIGLTGITILMATVIFFSRSEVSIFTGRDQGSISMAATELANHHRLSFSLPLSTEFFSLYGPGEALNFPGFFYSPSGALITKFPLGYTVFLAAFFQTFGISGFLIGNGILLIASTLSLFSLLRSFAPKALWGGMILFAGSLIPTFLFHLTLNENFALFLFLFLTFHLMEFFQKQTPEIYFGVIASVLLFPFVRVEGFAFLGITITLIVCIKKTRRFIKEKILERSILPIASFITLLIASFFANNPFYRVMGKEIFKSFTEKSGETPSLITAHLPALLSLYGLLPIIIIGLISVVVLIRSKKWPLLIPALLALPTFIYLLSPTITPDHPWMLRRFLFSVWPSLLLTLFFTIEFLLEHRRFQKKATILVIALLLLSEIPSIISLTSTAPSSPLLPQIASFATRFTPSDRILVDREASGDGFNMISGPLASLFHTNAAYFFNPLDMEKLSFPNDQTTYLLVPEEKSSFYTTNLPDFTLEKQDSIEFTSTGRETLPLSVIRFPFIETRTEKDTLFKVTPSHSR